MNRKFRYTGVLLLGLVLGCQQSRRGELREWTPADHHNNQRSAPARGDQSTGQADPNRPEGLEEVTLATWGQHCSTCHGRLGHGDGPQGRMLGAKDLTLPEYQASVSDDYLANTIRTGKGKMPSFKHLPDATIDHLVKLIRFFGSRAAGAAPASAEPTTSAEPGGTAGASALPSEAAPAASPEPPQAAAPAARASAAPPAASAAPAPAVSSAKP